MGTRAINFLRERFPGRGMVSCAELCKALGISRTTFWRMRKKTGIVGKDGNGGGIRLEDAVGLVNMWLAEMNPKHLAFFRNMPEELREKPKDTRTVPPLRKKSGVSYGPPLKF